jgi:O-acetyl-ADP-ribose deacetylase (regulator of RNase III)
MESDSNQIFTPHPAGDMFQEQVDVLFNPVNCQGVSGKGLALEFKHLYPRAQGVYEKYCQMGSLNVGSILVAHADGQFSLPFIIFFPTKKFWIDKSQYKWIEEGMGDFVKWARSHPEVQTFAIPALGCGLGGLEWKQVRSIILSAFGKLPHVTRVHIYPPHNLVQQP